MREGAANTLKPAKNAYGMYKKAFDCDLFLKNMIKTENTIKKS